VTAYEQATGTTATSSDRPATEQVKTQASAVAGTAKNEAGNVAGAVGSAASDVVGTAKDQAGQVATEAKNQISTLASQAKTQVSEQVTTQTQKAAQTTRTFADQLQAMARGEASEGPANTIVRELSERVQQFADKLENTEPQELLDEVRRYARSKPGMFLVGAVAAGFATGRLVKGATAEDSSSNGAKRDRSYDSGLYSGSNTGGRAGSAGTFVSPGATGTSDYSAGYGGTAAGEPTIGLETTGAGYPAYGAETYPEEPRQGSLGGSI